VSELNTRKEKRTPVTLKIKFKSATLEQFIERYSVDVSQGGIFIRTKDPLAVGTQLRFEFQLQDASPLISGDGTVVWTREFDPSRVGVAPGMGVRFDRLAVESQAVLEQILSRKSGSSKATSDSFDIAHDPTRQTGEKTKITPPNLASSLAAAARSPGPAEKSPVPRLGTLAPPRGGFTEEPSKDGTPLPKPMPFTAAGDDELGEEIFDQPTKVASIESLIRHEEEQARAAQAAAQAAHQREVDDEEQTAVKQRPRTKPEIHVVAPNDLTPPLRPAPRPPEPPTPSRPPPPPVMARPVPMVPPAPPAAPVPLAAASSPPPPPPRRVPTTPPQPVPAMAGRGSEPLFLQRAGASAPAQPVVARPATVVPPPRASVAPYIVGGAAVLLAGAAAVYMFVIRPQLSEPPPRPPVVKKAAASPEPAVGPTAPAPAPTPPPQPPPPSKPAPAPAVVAKKVDVKVTSRPPGASVALDGSEHGVTPTTLAGLETAKSYAVSLKAACFKTENIELTPKDDSPELQVTLKPLERVVHVKSDPPGVFLSVDGRPAGKTPTDVRLVGKLDAKAAHVFLLHKAGFETAQTTVSPDSPCATEGDVGALGLSVSLTPIKKLAEPPPAPAAAKVAPKPPEPPAQLPQKVEPPPEPPKPVPVETPKAEPPPEPPKPVPVETPKAEPPPEPPRPEPAKPVEAKPEPAPPKTEPKKAEPAPPAEKKDCDPSPDAPEWARCK
jgi:uncharacterized protein (TIGR02266 family)